MPHPEDHAAFERLFRAHLPAVRAYARRRIDATTAEDVVAETFVVCWRRLDDVPDDPLPWLLGVARRCLANRRRSDDRRSALAERAGAELPGSTARDVADPSASATACSAVSRLCPRTTARCSR